MTWLPPEPPHDAEDVAAFRAAELLKQGRRPRLVFTRGPHGWTVRVEAEPPQPEGEPLPVDPPVQR